MDGNRKKESSSYRRERDSFLKNLEQFHATRGTPYARIPCIGSKEIDMYLLYNKVTSMGGWEKVTDFQLWEEIQEEFNIPSGCTNAGEAMKQIYIRYLGIFETIHHKGENPDKSRQSEAEDGLAAMQKRKKGPPGGVSLTYNTQQHNVTAHQRKQHSMSKVFVDPRQHMKLEKSLLCGLPNEVDFAMNICTLLSNEGRHSLQLQECPRILELLLAHVGVFKTSDDSLRELHLNSWCKYTNRNFLRFWYESIEDSEIRELIVPESLRDEKGCKDTDVEITGSTSPKPEDVLQLGRDVGIYDKEGQRVTQLASIIRNWSFEKDNIVPLATNTSIFRFLMMCIHNKCNNLKQLALDTLSNIAIQMVLEPIDNRITKLVIKTLSRCICSPDKFEVVSGLETLAKLCQVDANEDVLVSNIERKTYEDVISLLTLQDIQLIVYTLECVYQLSELGHVSTTAIARVSNSVATLVSLVTVEAQSYGPESIRGIKVVEHIPPGAQPITAQAPSQSVIPPTPVQPQQVSRVAHTPQQGGTPHRQAQLTPRATPSPQPRRSVSASAPNTPPQAKPQTAESLALAWLRSYYEPAPENRVSRMNLYTEYISTLNRLQIKLVANTNIFNNSVRVVYPSVELVTDEREDGSVNAQYKGLKKRFVALPFPPEKAAMLPPKRIPTPNSSHTPPQTSTPVIIRHGGPQKQLFTSNVTSPLAKRPGIAQNPPILQPQVNHATSPLGNQIKGESTLIKTLLASKLQQNAQRQPGPNQPAHIQPMPNIPSAAATPSQLILPKTNQQHIQNPAPVTHQNKPNTVTVTSTAVIPTHAQITNDNGLSNNQVSDKNKNVNSKIEPDSKKVEVIKSPNKCLTVDTSCKPVSVNTQSCDKGSQNNIENSSKINENSSKNNENSSKNENSTKNNDNSDKNNCNNESDKPIESQTEVPLEVPLVNGFMSSPGVLPPTPESNPPTSDADLESPKMAPSIEDKKAKIAQLMKDTTAIRDQLLQVNGVGKHVGNGDCTDTKCDQENADNSNNKNAESLKVNGNGHKTETQVLENGYNSPDTPVDDDRRRTDEDLEASKILESELSAADLNRNCNNSNPKSPVTESEPEISDDEGDNAQQNQNQPPNVVENVQENPEPMDTEPVPPNPAASNDPAPAMDIAAVAAQMAQIEGAEETPPSSMAGQIIVKGPQGEPMLIPQFANVQAGAQQVIMQHQSVAGQEINQQIINPQIVGGQQQIMTEQVTGQPMISQQQVVTQQQTPGQVQQVVVGQQPGQQIVQQPIVQQADQSQMVTQQTVPGQPQVISQSVVPQQQIAGQPNIQQQIIGQQVVSQQVQGQQQMVTQQVIGQPQFQPQGQVPQIMTQQPMIGQQQVIIHPNIPQPQMVQSQVVQHANVQSQQPNQDSQQISQPQNVTQAPQVIVPSQQSSEQTSQTITSGATQYQTQITGQQQVLPAQSSMQQPMVVQQYPVQYQQVPAQQGSVSQQGSVQQVPVQAGQPQGTYPQVIVQHPVVQQSGQVAQPGQVVGQPGQLVTQQGQVVAQPGQVVTQQGQVIAQSGQVVTQTGQMVSQQGQVVAQQGQVVTPQGQVVTQQGQMVTQTGQVVTQQGQVVAQQGQVVGQAGQVLAQPGQVVTQQGQVVAQPGQVVTQQGQVVTQQGQVVAQPGQIVTQQGQVVAQPGQYVQHVQQVVGSHSGIQTQMVQGQQTYVTSSQPGTIQTASGQIIQNIVNQQGQIIQQIITGPPPGSAIPMQLPSQPQIAASQSTSDAPVTSQPAQMVMSQIQLPAPRVATVSLSQSSTPGQTTQTPPQNIPIQPQQTFAQQTIVPGAPQTVHSIQGNQVITSTNQTVSQLPYSTMPAQNPQQPGQVMQVRVIHMSQGQQINPANQMQFVSAPGSVGQLQVHATGPIPSSMQGQIIRVKGQLPPSGQMNIQGQVVRFTQVQRPATPGQPGIVQAHVAPNTQSFSGAPTPGTQPIQVSTSVSDNPILKQHLQQPSPVGSNPTPPPASPSSVTSAGSAPLTSPVPGKTKKKRPSRAKGGEGSSSKKSKRSRSGSVDSQGSSQNSNDGRSGQPSPLPITYMCEWAGCRKCFETSNKVMSHAMKEHFNKALPYHLCFWDNCDQLKRQRWSFVQHLQDKHVSESALRAASMRRNQAACQQRNSPSPAPTAQSQAAPPVYPENAAVQAIRRFAVKQPYPEFQELKEGPVTKHIRLTSALILRNLARYSSLGRTLIKRHEQHLAYVALSNVESSSAISNCLWELHKH